MKLNCRQLNLKRFVRHVSLVAFMLLTGQSFASPNAEDVYRYRLATVPKLEKGPVIDGEISDAEWRLAASEPRLVFSNALTLTPRHAQFLWAYTDDALYIAFKIERDPAARKPTGTVTQRDKNMYRIDDYLELMLHPSSFERKLGYAEYYLCLNSIGTRWDRTETPKPDLGWNPDWIVACKVLEDYGWQGEIRIPFKQLPGYGRTPKAGEPWGYDIMDNDSHPSVTAQSACRPSFYQGIPDLSNLIFADSDAPYVRVLDAGMLRGAGKTAGLRMELMPGISGREAELKYTVQIYRRKAGEERNFLKTFDEQRDRAWEVNLSRPKTMISDEKLLPAVLSELFEAPETKEETVKVAKPYPVDIFSSETPGHYLIMYQVTDTKTGKIIAGAPLPFEIPEPMQSKAELMPLAAKKLKVQTDLSFIPAWKGRGSLEARLDLPDAPEGASPLYRNTWQASELGSPHAFDIDVRLASPGTHTLTLILRNDEGNEVMRKAIPVAIPGIPEWFAKPEGLAPLVPSPWTPLEVVGRKIRFITGQYVFDTSPMPVSAKVKSIYDPEDELLMSPIEIKARVNGTPVEWRPTMSSFGAIGGDKVEWVTENVGQGLLLRSISTVEYDGMIKCKMIIESQDPSKPVKLDGLCLEIPLRKKYGQLYRRGQLFDVSKADVFEFGAVPSSGLRHIPSLTTWLGNEDRGMQWFTENMKGWKIGQGLDEQAIETVPEGEHVTHRINFIQDKKPLLLNKPREITFGFIMTPARPRSERVINFAYSSTTSLRGAKDDQIVEKLMKEESQLGLNAQHVWAFYVDKENITMQGWPQILKPDVAELSKRRIEMAHRYGQKIIPYGPWYLCRKATDYPVFGREMWAEPFRDMSCFGTGHCWNSPFADLFVWLQVQRVRDMGIDGFRSDGSTDPLICSSLEHTAYGSQCGWLDDNGKLQGSFGIFATREALKRLWRIFHGGERPDGICAHGSGLGYDALYNHIDITIDSEGSETFSTKALKDKPLDYWRASKLWRPHGLQSIYGGKLLHLGMDSRHAIAVIHDLLPRSSPAISSRVQALDYAYSRQGEGIVQVVWALRQWIGAKDLRTRFYGYWENQGWVNTGSEDLPVGVYLMEGRKAALVIGNMSRKSELAAVTLKKAKFHFGDNPWNALDPATGVRYEVKDNGDSVKLTIPVGAESFRMVMLSPTPLKADVPAVKGKSLIDIADFAGADKAANVVKIAAGNDPGKFTGPSKSVSLETGKAYRLTCEARVIPAEPPYLGSPGATLKVGVNGGKDFQGIRQTTLATQFPDGYWEPMTVYFSPSVEKCSVFLQMNGKGTAEIRNIQLVEVERMAKLHPQVNP